MRIALKLFADLDPKRDWGSAGTALSIQVAQPIWPEKMNWVGGMRVAYRDFYRRVYEVYYDRPFTNTLRVF